MHISFLKKKKKIVEWICGNDIAKIGGGKNLLQLVCGNAIAEMGGKKFVAMPLPKMGEKKIVVAEIWGGIKKKKYNVHNIFITNHM